MKAKRRSRGAATALVASAALVLSACGSDTPDDTTDPQATTGGSYSIYIGDPENPLIPGNTSESEGGQVVESMWTGLVQYNVETSELEFTGVAESIESEDNISWTVTLKDGWTFHDGTPVTAESFVNAWNYTALSTNAQGNSYFFSDIVGYGDLQGETNEAGEVVTPPAAEELTGLAVVDELSFTVELAAPFRQWPLKTGYTAFFPLPEAFFSDPETFGAQPIGNGPFMATAPFVEGQGFTLSRFEEYAGEDVAQADELEYRVYAEVNTAYTDVQAGNLDIVDTVPPDAIGSAADEFGERFLERSSSTFTYVGFPLYDPRYADKRVRQGLSLAIDREAITEAIFNGTRAPAYSVISPVVDGSREDACEYCFQDVERGRQLLEEAGFDFAQPVELWFNAGAGHDQWVEAVGNQLQQNLGISYTLKGDLQFEQYLPLGDEKGYTGPFRLGWGMDYPSPENYLAPLYTVAAQPPNGSNSTFYDNPEFEDLLAQGNAADSNEDAVASYQQAEDVLLEDMPVMPMFFGLVQSVHSENVANVTVDAFGRVDTSAVTVNQ